MASTESKTPLVTLMEELDLPPSRCSTSEAEEIMSYEDIMIALAELQFADQIEYSDSDTSDEPSDVARDSANLDLDLNSNNASAPSPADTAIDHEFGQCMDCVRLVPVSSLRRLASNSNSEEEYGVACPARLSSLIEFGAHNSIQRLSTFYTKVSKRSSCVLGEETTSSISNADSGDNENAQDIGSTATEAHDERDDKTNIKPYMRYSSGQLTLFGDFLRSPFALAHPPTSEAKSKTKALDICAGAGPHETKEHTPCDRCDRCLLVAFALSRNLSETHPATSWLAERDFDDFGVAWQRLFSAMKSVSANSD